MLTSSERSDGAAISVPAIEATAVGKTFQLGQLADVARRVSRRARRSQDEPAPEPFHALRDVTFTLPVGECVGILGSNGSGKTTLVQIIAGIGVPSEGEMKVRGRILPLLEVGAGFHAELTGRENIILFGTILGLDSATIKAAIPHIRDFAELDEAHIDTPVKRYSLGMIARLSFGVAMMFPADIYIFDEVIAVVDDHFRAVALNEIEQLRHQGATVLFISHDLPVVRKTCSTGLWLERGRLRMEGPIEEVADAYEAFEAAQD